MKLKKNSNRLFVVFLRATEQFMEIWEHDKRRVCLVIEKAHV